MEKRMIKTFRGVKTGKQLYKLIVNERTRTMVMEQVTILDVKKIYHKNDPADAIVKLSDGYTMDVGLTGPSRHFNYRGQEETGIYTLYTMDKYMMDYHIENILVYHGLGKYKLIENIM